MSKHTKEPWRIGEYRNFVTPDGPLYLGGVTTPLALGDAMRKGWENARRIVACVNACEGIDTDYLEKNGLRAFSEKISTLVEQRAELLEALVSIVDEGLSTSRLTKARAAIAKATGEQS